MRSGERLRGGLGERGRRFLSPRDDVNGPVSWRDGLRDDARFDFLW